MPFNPHICTAEVNDFGVNTLSACKFEDFQEIQNY